MYLTLCQLCYCHEFNKYCSNVSIFLLSAQGSPPSSPPLPFPRTVPRTTSTGHYAPVSQGTISPHGRTPDGTGGTLGRHQDSRNDYSTDRTAPLPRVTNSTSTDR